LRNKRYAKVHHVVAMGGLKHALELPSTSTKLLKSFVGTSTNVLDRPRNNACEKVSLVLFGWTKGQQTTPPINIDQFVV
jgi:hypothetical protein